MSLPCRSWPNQTAGTTQQLAACLDVPGEAGMVELDDDLFIIAVLDALQRRASGIGTGTLPTIQSLAGCDVAQAARDARCALQNLTVATGYDPAKFKAIILTMLNNFLCT